MELLSRVLSGNGIFSSASTSAKTEAQSINHDIKTKLETLKEIVALDTNSELSVLLDMIYDSSFPEQQMFMKEPNKSGLQSNKELMLRILSGLESLGVPVAEQMRVFTTKYGFEGIEDALFTILELMMPLLENKAAPEFTTDDVVAAMDFEWHSSAFRPSPSPFRSSSSPLLTAIAPAAAATSPLLGSPSTSPFRRAFSDRNSWFNQSQEMAAKTTFDRSQSHQNIFVPPQQRNPSSPLAGNNTELQHMKSLPDILPSDPKADSGKRHRRKGSSLEHFFGEDVRELDAEVSPRGDSLSNKSQGTEISSRRNSLSSKADGTKISSRRNSLSNNPEGLEVSFRRNSLSNKIERVSSSSRRFSFGVRLEDSPVSSETLSNKPEGPEISTGRNSLSSKSESSEVSSRRKSLNSKLEHVLSSSRRFSFGIKLDQGKEDTEVSSRRNSLSSKAEGTEVSSRRNSLSSKLERVTSLSKRFSFGIKSEGSPASSMRNSLSNRRQRSVSDAKFPDPNELTVQNTAIHSEASEVFSTDKICDVLEAGRNNLSSSELTVPSHIDTTSEDVSVTDHVDDGLESNGVEHQDDDEKFDHYNNTVITERDCAHPHVETLTSDFDKLSVANASLEEPQHMYTKSFPQEDENVEDYNESNSNTASTSERSVDIDHSSEKFDSIVDEIRRYVRLDEKEIVEIRNAVEHNLNAVANQFQIDEITPKLSNANAIINQDATTNCNIESKSAFEISDEEYVTDVLTNDENISSFGMTNSVASNDELTIDPFYEMLISNTVVHEEIVEDCFKGLNNMKQTSVLALSHEVNINPGLAEKDAIAQKGEKHSIFEVESSEMKKPVLEQDQILKNNIVESEERPMNDIPTLITRDSKCLTDANVGNGTDQNSVNIHTEDKPSDQNSELLERGSSDLIPNGVLVTKPDATNCELSEKFANDAMRTKLEVDQALRSFPNSEAHDAELTVQPSVQKAQHDAEYTAQCSAYSIEDEDTYSQNNSSLLSYDTLSVENEKQRKRRRSRVLGKISGLFCFRIQP